jgi:hypothetical protein
MSSRDKKNVKKVWPLQLENRKKIHASIFQCILKIWLNLSLFYHNYDIESIQLTRIEFHHAETATSCDLNYSFCDQIFSQINRLN